MITTAIVFFVCFILSFVIDFICAYMIKNYETQLKYNNLEINEIENIKNKTNYILITIGVSLLIKVISVVGLIMLLIVKFLTMWG